MEEKRPIIVSIKCITYNHASFIRQCLDGFVKQKTNFRFEAIVHDDASTDGTADIIREYAEKYPDIIRPILETENQYSKGKGALTKIMHEACKGKYVALCEGDDYWTDPLKLQKQVDFMESDTEEKYVMCFHDSTVVDKDGNIIQNTHLGKNQYQDLTGENLMTLNHPPTQTILFRQKCYAEEFDAIMKSYYVVNQDTILNYMLGKHGAAKYLPNVENSIYRIHPGGIWSMKSEVQQKEMLYVLFSFLRNQDIRFKRFYDIQRKVYAARIVELATKSRDYFCMSKYFIIASFLSLKMGDMQYLINIPKGVVYNIIHK